MHARAAMRIAATMAASAAVALLRAQQPAPPQDPNVFRAGTTLVPVDVRILDRRGQPVTDLKESDFTILEDGVPQRIGHFSTQGYAPEPPSVQPARPKRAADALEMTSLNLRTFLIVLGRGRLQPPADGVDAMLHLVQARVLPQDQVAVLAWNRATDFTTDREPLIQVLNRFKREHNLIETQIQVWETSLQRMFDPRIPDYIQKSIDAVFGGPSARGTRTMSPEAQEAARIEEQTNRVGRDVLGGGGESLSPVDRAELERLGGNLDDFLHESTQTLQDLQGLYMGVEYLRHLAGEKHLIFVSEYGIRLPAVEDDRNLGRLAADARVVLDVIHSGGVPLATGGIGDASRGSGRGIPSALRSPPAGFGIGQAMTARNLTKMTGGQFHAHEFKNASMDADAIDTSARFQYVLGYYPAKTTWDNKYRRIAVKVNRPDVTVLYRDGYFARREIGPLERRKMVTYSRVASAAGSVTQFKDLAIPAGRAVATMTGKTGHVQVDLTIDVSRVSFEVVNGRHRGSIDVAVFCAGRGDSPLGHSWETLELTYTDARLAAVKQTGLAHHVTIPVTGNPENLKVVVYDYGADLVGTTVVKVTGGR